MSITATQEELLDIKMQIADLRNKIRSLDVEMEEKEVVQNATTNNDVFFLQSEMGKVYFLESLRKNIPEAYYPDFKKLLESIKNGTFIGKKYLIDLNYFELKEFKVRLTFDKLSDGNYIVIDGFMKKEDTSSKYKNYMRQMDKVYCSRQNFYIENHLNPDFLATHTTYYQDIIDMLDKPQGLKRGGEENA